MATYNAVRKQVVKWPAGRYRLTERSEIARNPGAVRELLDEGTEVVWDGMPGPHMEPLDAQAHANVQHVVQHLGGFKALDPTQNLSLIVGEYDDADNKIAELMAQIDTIRSTARSNVASGMPTQIAPPKPLDGSTPVPAPEAAAMIDGGGLPGQGGSRVDAPPLYIGAIPKAPPLPPR